MISVVVPVHNEERYLPYFVWGLRRAIKSLNEPYEVVFSLDRCSDRSEEIIRRHMPQAKVFFKKHSQWRNKCAENFDYSIRKSSGEIIYALAADLVLDPRVFKYVYLLNKNKIGALSFNYINYDPFRGGTWKIRESYYNLLKKLLNTISPYKHLYHSGVIALRRDAYYEVGGLRDVPSEYDDLLSRMSKKGFKHLYIKDVNIIHLRPGFSHSRQMLQGMSRAHLGYPLWKVTMHATLYLKPVMLRSYIQERRYGIYRKRAVWTK